MEQVAQNKTLERSIIRPVGPLTVFHPVRETYNVPVATSPSTSTRPCSCRRNSGDGLARFVDEIKVMVTRGLAVEGTVGHIVMSDAEPIGRPTGRHCIFGGPVAVWGGSHVWNKTRSVKCRNVGIAEFFFFFSIIHRQTKSLERGPEICACNFAWMDPQRFVRSSLQQRPA